MIDLVKSLKTPQINDQDLEKKLNQLNNFLFSTFEIIDNTIKNVDLKFAKTIQKIDNLFFQLNMIENKYQNKKQILQKQTILQKELLDLLEKSIQKREKKAI